MMKMVILKLLLHRAVKRLRLYSLTVFMLHGHILLISHHMKLKLHGYCVSWKNGRSFSKLYTAGAMENTHILFVPGV